MVQGCCRKKVSDRLSGREMGTILPGRWNTYCKLLATAKIWQRPGTKTAVRSFLPSILACCSKTRSRLKADDNFWVIQVIDKAKGWAFIMEIKRAANEKENLADLVAEGLGQISGSRYDVQLLATSDLTVVFHWSVAFCKKTCDARAVLVRRTQQAELA